ncbi:hypothetical protein BC833DRAFT_583856, partial [Globomyces pollinis-pini]
MSRNNDNTGSEPTRVVFKNLWTFGFKNDLLIGGWIFFWASLASIFIPIWPLYQAYHSVFVLHNTIEGPHTFDDICIEYYSLAVMGLFFTTGSLIFMRPLHKPPKKPLLGWISWLRTDEIFSAWHFFLASVPSVFYVSVFLADDIKSLKYWLMMIAAVFFVIISGVFLILTYYEYSSHHNQWTVYLRKIFGKRDWIEQHLYTDWLIGLWICYYGCILITIGSFSLLLFYIYKGKSSEYYLMAAGGIDMLLFTLGFAYLIAGSYDPYVLPSSPHL